MSIKDLDADLSEVKRSTHQPEMPLQGYTQKSQSWYKRWLSNNKEFTTSSLYLRRQLIRPVSLQAKGHVAHKSEKYAHQAKAEHRQPVRHRHHNAQHVFLRLSWKKVHLLHIYYSLSYHKVIGTCLMVVLCKTDREDYKSTGLYIAEMACQGLRNIYTV
jgi:hypothetical protein